MNSNQEQSDLPQYSIKCANILGNIFESVDKWYASQNEDEKDKFKEILHENITNFELTLDKCYVDVNESISQIAMTKFGKRNSNQGDLSITDEQIPEDKLINDVANKIANIKLKV